MSKTIEPPCKKVINQEEFFREEAWVIRRKEVPEVIVTSEIDNKTYPMFVSAFDIITKEIMLIPVHTIDIIERKTIVGIKFYCQKNEPRTKDTDKYICYYDIPLATTYRNESYGKAPFKWQNAD